MIKAFTLLTLMFSGICAVAANAATMNLTLNPLVAELRVAPGEAGHTSTIVSNTGDTEERVVVQPLDWTTRVDGSIAMQHPGAQGDHSLTAWLEPSTYGFILHAHESRRLDIALAVPGHPAMASTWGGFLVRASAIDGFTAIGPAATFFVYNDSSAVRRHLELTAMRAIVRTNRMTVHISLHNDGDAYARAAGILTVLRGTSVVERSNVSIGAIFPGKDRTLQIPARLEKGAYTVRFDVDYSGDTIAAAQTTVTIP